MSSETKKFILFRILVNRVCVLNKGILVPEYFIRFIVLRDNFFKLVIIIALFQSSELFFIKVEKLIFQMNGGI